MEGKECDQAEACLPIILTCESIQHRPVDKKKLFIPSVRTSTNRTSRCADRRLQITSPLATHVCMICTVCFDCYSLRMLRAHVYVFLERGWLTMYTCMYVCFERCSFVSGLERKKEEKRAEQRTSRRVTPLIFAAKPDRAYFLPS